MDPILYWNEVALEANRVSHTNGLGEQTGPCLSSRALAIVHLAMHDAYVAIEPGPKPYRTYLPTLPPAPTIPTPAPEKAALLAAAVAGAAMGSLRALFPAQTAYFDQRYLDAGLSGPTLASGWDFGQAIAKRLLALRSADDSASSAGYAPSLARGRHRVDPDSPEQGFYAPYYGERTPGFAAQKRYQLDVPPLDNAEYLAALDEVRRLGIAPALAGTLENTAQKRTALQTLIGIYWGYDGTAGLGTPPRLFNQIVRRVSAAQQIPPLENARLFALVNVAMADAGILAWREKYRHDLWRPVLGIREHDASLGPAGQPGHHLVNGTDAEWLPLGAPKSNGNRLDPKQKNFTPPFPAYPSGHATFGAAALHMARLFFNVPIGNRNPDTLFNGLEFVSDEFNGHTRDLGGAVRPRHARAFPSGLWQMIEENGRSRVYLGVHWIFDAFAADDAGKYAKKIGGVRLGLDIAEDIFSSMLKPSPTPWPIA